VWPFARLPTLRLRQAGRPARPLGDGFARAYLAASKDRLVADLPRISVSANAELRSSLRILRARSRHLARNNDYARGFFKTLKNNIAGPQGFVLQVRARHDPTKDDPSGPLDIDANRRIEAAHERWSRPGWCTADGRLSRADAERLFIMLVARDGEVLVRHVRNAANDWGYAIQFLPADLLDEELNVAFGGGSIDGYVVPREHEIRMGVERDRWRRPLAYHLFTAHPNDDLQTIKLRRRERIPAGDLIHAFVAEDADEARGVPWLFSAMRRLAMLGGYEEAELVAARVAASKMGFYKEAAGMPLQADGTDAGGNLIRDAEPGHFERLPAGVDIATWDPQHPSGQFAPFAKAMLRGAAVGTGTSYNLFASDLESVNYSSLRQGALNERDEWRALQRWQCSVFCAPVYGEWLRLALTTGALALPAEKFAKFDAPEFQPRGWVWVDPLKEIEAEERAVALRVKSRTEICAERGRDFEDVIRQIASEGRIAAANGVELPLPGPPSFAKATDGEGSPKPKGPPDDET